VEALAIEMYARGLSTRDIEALFADEDGRSLLSRTAVTEISERLWAEYEAFASRDLSEFDVIYLDVIYLFVDGIAERLHLGQPREAVLAAWGILADGKKVLLHLAPGTKPRRTPRAAASSRRCADAACPIRCWWWRWCRRCNPCDRGMLPALGCPALPGPQDAQPAEQGARGSARGSRRAAPIASSKATPFPPAAERWTLTWVLSIAAAPITPLRPPHPS